MTFHGDGNSKTERLEDFVYGNRYKGELGQNCKLHLACAWFIIFAFYYICGCMMLSMHEANHIVKRKDYHYFKIVLK